MSASLVVSPSLAPVVGVETIPLSDANKLLTEWGHYLGPCNRPFASRCYALHVEGRPVSVAVSTSIVSPTVTDELGRQYRCQEVVELARLCSSEPWATRVMLRLWREVHAPSWPYWPVAAAVAYSQNVRHDGRIYRFDGWTKVRDDAGSSGGGAWSRKRYGSDAVPGRKTLWMWRYGGAP